MTVETCPSAAICAWCSAAIPAGVRGAHAVHAGEHTLPVCSAGCLTELVALVAGVRLLATKHHDELEAAFGPATVRLLEEL